MKKKWKEIVEEYGKLAFVVYMTIFAFTLSSFFLLLKFGFSDILLGWFDGYVSADIITTSTGVMAYALTKITQPIRIFLTISLLPVLSRWRKQED
jgi:uncharacterized membrane protein AbrB (regulator of aidB expression)